MACTFWSYSTPKLWHWYLEQLWSQGTYGLLVVVSETWPQGYPVLPHNVNKRAQEGARKASVLRITGLWFVGAKQTFSEMGKWKGDFKGYKVDNLHTIILWGWLRIRRDVLQVGEVILGSVTVTRWASHLCLFRIIADVIELHSIKSWGRIPRPTDSLHKPGELDQEELLLFPSSFTSCPLVSSDATNVGKAGSLPPLLRMGERVGGCAGLRVEWIFGTCPISPRMLLHFFSSWKCCFCQGIIKPICSYEFQGFFTHVA